MAHSDLTFPPLPGVALTPIFQESRSPMGRNIGLVYLAAGEKRICTGLKWDETLVGNAETGVLHGGVVTTMIDETAGGASVLASDYKFSVATIDLRVDYMRPAEARKNLYCTAHIYRLTRRIAFFNAEAFHDDPSKPIAVGTGTFMLGANASVPDILDSPFRTQDNSRTQNNA
jgi:uncharacterized protein (TIGR00369 family)